MKKILNIAIIVAAAGFASCEDVIDLEVPAGKVFPVVDAWLTDENGPQHIRITETVPYTSQAPAPVIKDAVVTITDLTDSKVYPFVFADGQYTHNPGQALSIGKVGHAYKLRVELKSQVYEAIDTLKRSPKIDSITYKFKKKEDSGYKEDGYVARFYARDLAGGTDYYWIRSYRNNRENSNRLRDMTSIDGSFYENVTDGILFIEPIMEGINREDKPFQADETVIVRLAGCTKASHAFLEQLNNQLSNGGLFAKVLENIKSNITNTNPAGKERVLGWFGASSVKIEQKKIAR